ncbi:RDD family protein [Kitasatospora sp. NBC_00240]|uniref:RDD family protein n=1 Tax=Kitasatospora sp. NBC_00240 TaxID=2903567 RepID=UPI00225BA5EB|nr:RDD family protein [Kitasatospora sp. NBC_00240]MCX5212620.1 RDD family protein [Kitasatospora sp. NBC_00240]
MSDLVTGEAVVLGLRAAKLPSRALAVALDLLVQCGGLLLAIVVLAFAAPDIDTAAAVATMLAMTVFFLVGLPVMVETLSGGRSLGKLAFGLRVVRRDGGPVRFRHALVRGLIGFFEIISLSGVPAVVCSLVSQDGRRLGDVFAGTLVVRERVPGAGRGGVTLPPLPPQLMQALGGELVALDLSAVPEGLWLAVRQFLGRLTQLDPQIAQTMAVQLTADLVASTGHPAPVGVHPAAYLGAVLAERQRREWARATGPGTVQPAPWGPGPAGQPYPGQPYPGQPYAGQPYAAQPLPWQPAAPQYAQHAPPPYGQTPYGQAAVPAQQPAPRQTPGAPVAAAQQPAAQAPEARAATDTGFAPPA